MAECCFDDSEALVQAKSIGLVLLYLLNAAPEAKTAGSLNTQPWPGVDFQQQGPTIPIDDDVGAQVAQTGQFVTTGGQF